MANKGVRFKDAQGNKIYPCPYFPVGAIYISTTSTNPSTYFGGTWQQIQGRFLLGAGTTKDSRNESKTFTAGNTGGEFNHKLTTAEMPKHSHDLNGYTDAVNSGTNYYRTVKGANSYGVGTTKEAGSDGVHNNMPPYLVVYIWKRTA